MWLDPFQVDVLLSLSTKGSSVFVSKHLTSVALNLGGMTGAKGNGEGRDKVKILSHWMQQLFLKCFFFLNCLAVTRTTKTMNRF